MWAEHVGLAWEWTHRPSMEYSVWGRDRAPETGREHYHVYVRFSSRKRMQTVLNEIGLDGAACHAEAAKGTEQDCRDYCWKQGNNDKESHGFIEAGPEFGAFKPDAGKAGKRSDLEEIAEGIKSGASLKDIAESHPSDYIRYHSGIQALHALSAPRPPLERAVQILVLWGPTGTGKTHRVMHAYPDIYSVKPGRDPWGTYRGEAQILFDEFDYEKWSLQDMNRYLDKWRCLLDARYQDRYAVWTLVAICANSPPNSWWPNAAPLLMDAFLRRVRNQVWLVESQELSLDQLTLTPPHPV